MNNSWQWTGIRSPFCQGIWKFSATSRMSQLFQVTGIRVATSPSSVHLALYFGWQVQTCDPFNASLMPTHSNYIFMGHQKGPKCCTHINSIWWWYANTSESCLMAAWKSCCSLASNSFVRVATSPASCANCSSDFCIGVKGNHWFTLHPSSGKQMYLSKGA